MCRHTHTFSAICVLFFIIPSPKSLWLLFECFNLLDEINTYKLKANECDSAAAREKMHHAPMRDEKTKTIRKLMKVCCYYFHFIIRWSWMINRRRHRSINNEHLYNFRRLNWRLTWILSSIHAVRHTTLKPYLNAVIFVEQQSISAKSPTLNDFQIVQSHIPLCKNSDAWSLSIERQKMFYAWLEPSLSKTFAFIFDTYGWMQSEIVIFG